MFTTNRNFCFRGRSDYVQEKFKESLALLSLPSPTFSLGKVVVLNIAPPLLAQVADLDINGNESEKIWPPGVEEAG